MGHQYDLVCTVGKLNIKPGNTNVIADEVMLTFDIRSPKAELIQEAAAMIETLKKELEGDIEISVAVPCDEPPVALDEEGVTIMDLLAQRATIIKSATMKRILPGQKISKQAFIFCVI